MNPASLVRRIEAGDPKAEEELVQAMGRGTALLLRRLAGDAELAQDLYQDTFRTVIVGLRKGQLKDPDKLAAFVRGTAKNLLRSEWRKRDRRGPHDDIDDVPLADTAPGQWDQARRAEDRRHVRRVLEEMPSERDRQVLYRHYLKEEDKGEICSQLDIGTGQFNLVLFRARQRFRRLIEKEPRRFEVLTGGRSESKKS
ncbi:MAG: sigma-70 family RNA polymerase sigma factor [Acidobacteriota bacterium]